mmetsp:Transcript_39969/g.123494  ORF Transcript_39969/g.123494 Transcript_39969/m.123494 type:complete len:370 (-) Transcript_39969:478-1587(-)
MSIAPCAARRPGVPSPTVSVRSRNARFAAEAAGASTPAAWVVRTASDAAVVAGGTATVLSSVGGSCSRDPDGDCAGAALAVASVGGATKHSGCAARNRFESSIAADTAIATLYATAPPQCKPGCTKSTNGQLTARRSSGDTGCVTSIAPCTPGANPLRAVRFRVGATYTPGTRVNAWRIAPMCGASCPHESSRPALRLWQCVISTKTTGARRATRGSAVVARLWYHQPRDHRFAVQWSPEATTTASYCAKNGRSSDNGRESAASSSLSTAAFDAGAASGNMLVTRLRSSCERPRAFSSVSITPPTLSLGPQPASTMSTVRFSAATTMRFIGGSFPVGHSFLRKASVGMSGSVMLIRGTTKDRTVASHVL